MRIVFLICLMIISTMANAQINITANGQTVKLTLADNDATDALQKLLGNGPIKVSMSDYGGFEKVGELPQSLPSDDRQITTEPGDVMLYLGRNIVIFYGSNRWDYTPLGKIEGLGAEELKAFFSNNPIEITLSTDGITKLDVSEINQTDIIFDLQGKRVHTTSRENLAPGTYIINGQKTIIGRL